VNTSVCMCVRVCVQSCKDVCGGYFCCGSVWTISISVFSWLFCFSHFPFLMSRGTDSLKSVISKLRRFNYFPGTKKNWIGPWENATTLWQSLNLLLIKTLPNLALPNLFCIPWPNPVVPLTSVQFLVVKWN